MPTQHINKKFKLNNETKHDINDEVSKIYQKCIYIYDNLSFTIYIY